MMDALLLDFKLFLTLLFIGFLIFLIDFTGFFNFPKTIIQFVSVPIQVGLYKTDLEIQKQASILLFVRRTAQEKEALSEQLAQVLSENAQLRKQLAETQALVAQKNALNTQNFVTVAARPIGVSRYLYIDKGSSDGIKPNQVVVYKENLLGKVIHTDPNKSQVMLITDPDFQLAAFTGSGDNKARGILSGQFGSDMLMDKILHKESIHNGDLVYSEGTEINIPRGLVLGQVSQVFDRDNQIFKQASVKPVFDIGNLDLVFVITN